VTRTTDPYEELAAIFLTNDEEAAPSAPVAPATGRRAAVELLMVGHLPIMGRLWLAPYADAVAREHGTTALIRLDGDDPMVQVLRGGPAEEEALGAGACRTLEDAIRHLARTVRAWIVRPPSRSEMTEVASADVDRITIISGADQAAVVSAYGMIKTISEAAEQTAHPLPGIGLAVIGAEHDVATSVADRLSRTTWECLGMEVPLTLPLPRMDASLRAGNLRSFPGQGRPLLAEVVTWIKVAQGAPVDVESGPVPVSAADLKSIVPDETADFGAMLLGTDDIEATVTGTGLVEIDVAPREPSPPAPEPAPEPHHTSPPRSPMPEPIEGTTPAGRIKLGAKAAATVEGKDPARAVEPAEDGRPVPLARYASAVVPDLEPLLPRCPGHERIELAVDPRGCVHVLGCEDQERSARLVAAWARSHRELLALACPGHYFDPAGRTVCHLFTDEPMKVADLHGGPDYLHLLTPITVEGKQGWYATPLNRPGV